MRLEMQIKRMLISSVLTYYKDDVINVFEQFFYNKDRLNRYNHKTGNAFLAILKNPQVPKGSQKFIRLVNIMFLSDALFLFLCCKQFHKTEIVNNFYAKVPEKFGLLTKSRLLLIDLRNTIAHYNFKDYEQNKYDYLDALLLFEIHMGSNIKGITKLPRFTTRPSVKMILTSIKKLRPDLLDIDINKDDEMEYFYNKHRVLVDLCDDIALYNGYETKDLPSPWTILREMYTLKSNYKKRKNFDIYSLPLFKSLKNKE